MEEDMDAKVEIQNVKLIDKLICSAKGLRNIADWMEEKVGHAEDCEVNVLVYEYPEMKTLGFKFDEPKTVDDEEEE